VTQVEMAPRIMVREDEEVSDLARAALLQTACRC
jgi:pyruvate/2-oxoglutarate dehydrogenase complex dihydrolipoamide dehydrogenase (E3) component